MCCGQPVRLLTMFSGKFQERGGEEVPFSPLSLCGTSSPYHCLKSLPSIVNSSLLGSIGLGIRMKVNAFARPK